MSVSELSSTDNGQGDSAKGREPRESCERLGRSHACEWCECERDSHRVLREEVEG